MPEIAALFVDPHGAYSNLPGVDLWDEARDARKYNGPFPVVAHPPCSRWCRLAGLVEARWGHRKGEDDGCFESALDSVRRYGGVLEHPAFSDAFPKYGLPAPQPGAWQATICGGWVTYVEQHQYGHPAKKATWLYAVTQEPPPPLRWSLTPDKEAKALVSWCGNNIASGEVRPRLSKKAASATPEAFRDTLIEVAHA